MYQHTGENLINQKQYHRLLGGTMTKIGFLQEIHRFLKEKNQFLCPNIITAEGHLSRLYLSGI